MIWADSFTGTEVEFIVCEIQYDLKLDILFIHDALKIVSYLFFPPKWLFQSSHWITSITIPVAKPKESSTKRIWIFVVPFHVLDL